MNSPSLIQPFLVTTFCILRVRKALMRLCLTTALLLASVTVAQAQLHTPNAGGSTPASQMAARAQANANPVGDAAANGLAGISPDDASADQPSSTQRIIRGQVKGTSSDPVLHYPYGRYGASLGNVDPNSLANSLANPLVNPLVNPGANPLVRGAPGTVPAPPFATTGRTPAFHRAR
jgi:hypothetical protein